MRLFKRKPIDCRYMQVGFNPNNSKKGLDIWLGNDDECNVAYHHFGIDELDWLIDYLSDIRTKMTATGK